MRALAQSRLAVGLYRTAGLATLLLACLAVFGAAPGWATVDLAVSQTASAGTVATGDSLAYTVTVANNGSDPASNVEVKDPLKATLAFDSASAGCALDQGTVRCSIGTLAPAGSTVVQISVRPVSQGTVTNTVTANADGQDANTLDNSASVTTTVLGRSDLALVIHDSPDPVHVGSRLKYTLKVSNHGPDRAAPVTLTDQLPPNVSFLNAGQSCSAAGLAVTCTIGAIDSGKSATRVIAVKPNRAGTISDSASAATSSSQVDANLANNSAVEGTRVTGSPRPTPPSPSCQGRPATIVDPAGGGPGTIIGTASRDVIVGFGGNDTIHAGAGNDLVCSGAGGDHVFGGLGSDRVFGGLGADHLGGLGGNDLLFGGGGGDLLLGGSGGDRLDGGPGRDHCLGGPGHDRKLHC